MTNFSRGSKIPYATLDNFLKYNTLDKVRGISYIEWLVVTIRLITITKDHFFLISVLDL